MLTAYGALCRKTNAPAIHLSPQHKPTITGSSPNLTYWTINDPCPTTSGKLPCPKTPFAPGAASAGTLNQSAAVPLNVPSLSVVAVPNAIRGDPQKTVITSPTPKPYPSTLTAEPTGPELGLNASRADTEKFTAPSFP